MKIITVLLSRKGIREVLLPLFAYVILLALLMPKVVSPYLRVLFFIYALFIFWVVWEYAFLESDQKPAQSGQRKFFIALLIGAAVFIVVSRLILFVRFGEAPLGYDTGFYIKSIESTFQSLTGHRVIRSLIWVPLLWLGVPKLYILHGLYVLFQFLLAGSVYTLARSLAFSSLVAQRAVLLFLFAMSMPQFFGYWWMFYQMQLALALLVMTIALILRRSPLAILIAGFGIGIHPATFLPLVMGIAFFAVFDMMRALMKWRPPRKETILILALGAIGLFSLRLIGFEFFLVYLRGPILDYGWFVSNYPPELHYLRGLYIPLSLFKLANIYVLPFTLTGLLLFLMHKFRGAATAAYQNIVYGRVVIFAFILLASFTLSSLPFIYQNRFLMILDLAMMVFAAYALLYFFQALLSDRKGRMIVTLFLVGFLVYASYTIWGQQPQLYADERREIERIAQIAEPSAYAMSTESLYTPWVSGFSGRTTIDPGYLSANRWNYEMWKEFWYGKSDARRHELLNMYDQPLYIFVGKRVPQTVRYKNFIESDPYFEQISPHVWWYDPRRISEQDIAAMYKKENPPTPVEVIPDEQTDALLDDGGGPNTDESANDTIQSIH